MIKFSLNYPATVIFNKFKVNSLTPRLEITFSSSLQLHFGLIEGVTEVEFQVPGWIYDV